MRHQVVINNNVVPVRERCSQSLICMFIRSIQFYKKNLGDIEFTKSLVTPVCIYLCTQKQTTE